jgi:hypothetical protein
MVEQCETECETTGGAIFCDGQFLATEDVNACADELAAEFDLQVDVDLEVDADLDVDVNEGCAGMSGDGDGPRDVDVDCSAASIGSHAGAGRSGMAALFAIGLAALIYRRRAR